MYSESDITRIGVVAQSIRKTIITMLAEAGSGHLAGPLGLADIFAALYTHVLNHHPQDPTWEDRDRLILSNGHCAPVRYAAMIETGYVPENAVHTLRRFGSLFQGHPERTRLSALETTSGPLGEGLGQAAGVALAARMDGRTFRTYCIMSDAEQQCGGTWEAVQFITARKLANLTAIIDRNGIQIGGNTEDVLPIEPLREKYEAFGWHTVLIDGNSIDMFLDAIATAHEERERPTVIIAHTIPGKGVPEIEGDYRWHGKTPTHEEASQWIAAL